MNGSKEDFNVAKIMEIIEKETNANISKVKSIKKKLKEQR